MALVDELVGAGVLRTPRIIAAFRAIHRSDFVPEELKDAAETVNAPLPIGAGQTISQPWTVAFMLELLDPEPGQKILDIGAGSGWQTALLAHLVSAPFRTVPRNPDPASTPLRGAPSIPGDRASRRAEGHERREGGGRVYAIERVPELCEFGKANVAKYHFLARGVVVWTCGDATEGIPEHAPYDRIVAAAAVREIPPAWRKQCVVGGIIVAPISGSIWRLRRIGEERWDEEEYPGFSFVPFIRNHQEARRSGESR